MIRIMMQKRVVFLEIEIRDVYFEAYNYKGSFGLWPKSHDHQKSKNIWCPSFEIDKMMTHESHYQSISVTS